MKESFVVRTEWAEQIDLLTDEQAGQLLKAWFRYHMDESVDVHDPVVMMAFSFNRSYFEECASRWAATVQARQEAGKKGGRPKKANGLSEKAKKPNAFLGFEEKAKKAVSVSESVSVSVPPDGGSKARKKKDGSDIEPKVQWAEFVTMTNAEHQRLLDTHGSADTARSWTTTRAAQVRPTPAITGPSCPGAWTGLRKRSGRLGRSRNTSGSMVSGAR